MASRVSIRRFWRDLRLVSVLLVWAAFGTGLVIYFDGSIKLSLDWHLAPPAPQRIAANEELYTGSIVVVPPQGATAGK